MKAILLIMVVGLFFLSFLITGCDQRVVDVPTDPTQVSSLDAKRVLAFEYDTTLPSGDFYNIALYSTSDNDKDVSDDIVVLIIGDSLVPLTYHNYPPFAPGWFSYESHALADEQQIRLKIDNLTVLNTFIKKIGKANAAFPAEYDYQQPLTLNWSVAATNEYQFVRAESWDGECDGCFLPYSSYSRRILNTAGSFTFPANCVSLVDDSLEQTIFILCVEEVNYKIVNTTAVMVYQEESIGYNFMIDKNSGHARSNRALDIHRAFNK